VHRFLLDRATIRFSGPPFTTADRDALCKPIAQIAECPEWVDAVEKSVARPGSRRDAGVAIFLYVWLRSNGTLNIQPECRWILAISASHPYVLANVAETIVPMSSQPQSSTQEVLAGLVERVTFHNAENGFCVLRAKARGHRDLVTVVGHAATIAAGEWITAPGEWVNDRIHGQQFKARFLRTSAPSTVDGIEKYLASGMIRGIGPVYAKKLVCIFGDKVFDVIEAEPAACARSTASVRCGLAASRLPGPNRRSCAKSWSSFTAMAWAQRGRCASSKPTAPMPCR
jgi:hypothetical protein